VGSQTRARRVERSVSHPVVPASIGPRPRRPRGFERMPPSFVVFLNVLFVSRRERKVLRFRFRGKET
jgi:hypothetical protein